MNYYFAFFCLGLSIGFAVGAWWFNQLLKQAVEFYNWRVREMAKQIDELRERRSGDEWKDAE